MVRYGGEWHMINGQKYHVSKNLFDKNQSSTVGFVREDGTINDNNNYRISDYIQLLPNMQYTVSNMNVNGLYPAVCFYTDNKTYISGSKYDGATVFTFTTPLNCKYVLVSYLASLVNNVMLNSGSTALPYEPYGNIWTDVPIPTRKLHNKTDVITSLPVDIYTDGQPIGANLFNVNDTSKATTLYCTISVSDGILTQTNLNTSTLNRSNWKIDGLQTGSSYILSMSFDNPNASELQLKIYDKNNNNQVAGNTAIRATTGEFSVTFTAPSTSCYVRIYSNTSSTTNEYTVVYSNIMLNTGNTALPYQPYSPVIINGNMVQNGTPTSASPIMPQECGDMTENLFDSWAAVGVLTSTGTIDNSSTYANYRTSDYIPVEEGSYTFSLDNTAYEQYDNTSSRYAFYDEDKVFINYDISLMRPARFEWTFTAPSNAKYVRLTGRISDDNIMLNSGSQSLPYEPYGYKLNIKTASTTTPVYLSEAETTRKIKKLVLTGQENWTKNDASNPSNYLYYQTGYLANKTCVCSHLADMGTLSASKVGIFNGNNVLYLNFGSAIMNAQPSGNTVEGLKEYLAAQYSAGTPVTVWYVLAEPTTGVVNEPIRKIGDYADSVIATNIPTTAGGIEFDVETTLKPSEVSLTYHGWHDISPEQYENGAWN